MVAKNLEDIIKKFLVKWKIKADRRFVVYLLFVLLSSIFWLLNQLEKEYETDISLPVRYTNFPKDKILVNELPNYFDLKVRAHGFKILEYKISNKFLPYTLDVNAVSLRLHSKSSYIKFFTLTRMLKENIEKQLSSELSVISISPDTLYFDFASRKFKEVPIVSQLKVLPANQFMVRGQEILEPDSITISGASAIVDTINKVFTKAQTINGLKSDFKDEVKLDKIAQVDFSAYEVDVYINVEKFTEGSQKIKLNIKNVPDSLILRAFPKEIVITYFVALSDYEKVLPQLFEASIDYKEISAKGDKLNVSIVNSPDFIKSLRYNPDSVEYIIEKK